MGITGEHLIETTPKEYMSALIDIVWPFDLFRSHIMRRPDRPARGSEGNAFGLTQKFGDAEVCNFQTATRIQKQIFGFNVA